MSSQFKRFPCVGDIWLQKISGLGGVVTELYLNDFGCFSVKVEAISSPQERYWGLITFLECFEFSRAEGEEVDASFGKIDNDEDKDDLTTLEGLLRRAARLVYRSEKAYEVACRERKQALANLNHSMSAPFIVDIEEDGEQIRYVGLPSHSLEGNIRFERVWEIPKLLVEEAANDATD